MRKLLRKLRYLLRRDRRADELAEEMEFHRQLAEREGLEEGLSPKDAAHRARRQMGNETLAREDARFVWSFPWLESLLQDLRYGVRMLARNGRSTVVTVLALAIGIGLNAGVFTAYKAMVTRPLDARAPAEMVNIALTRDSGATDYKFSYPDYEAYRDSVRSFSGLIAVGFLKATLANAGGMISQRAARAESGLGRLGLGPPGTSNAEFARVLAVSENYFEVLGVTAVQGRTFESIGIPELVANPAVLISENYWQRRFAGDPAMLGKTIHLNGLAVRIIGITPRDFAGTDIGAPAFWLPVSIEPLIHSDDQWLRDRENQRYRLFGRLAPGAGISQAQAEMSPIADHLRTLHDALSDAAKPVAVLIWPGSPFPLPFKMYGLDLIILLIMVAAAMVLAVACANVGSLQLARARSRQNELRTRLSLGASRLRVVRQLLTESALVSLLAGVLALLFSWAFTKVLATQFINSVPVDGGTLVFDVTPDLETLAYVLAASLIAGVLSGLAPAMESSRSALSSAVGASTSSVRSRRLQDVLVTAQVSLSLVLLITASMLIRTSMKALSLPTGYDSKHVINVDFRFPETSKYTAARKVAFVHELRTRLAALPGVTAISSSRPPGANPLRRTGVVAVDEAGASGQNVQWILPYNYVEANYFQTLSVPLLLGRGFQARGSESEYTFILSESAAELLWPNQNPIGRRVRFGPTDERPHRGNELLAAGPAYQVVGVVRDKRGLTLDGSDSKEVYLPLAEDQYEGRPILVQTRSDPARVMRAIDPLISSIDPNMTVNSATLEEMLRQSPIFFLASLGAAIALTIGFFGLLLALMGIYGTVSYIVVLRTREVGIRMAVGAQKRDVLSLILRESARPVLAGVLVGMFLAVGASYLARGLFFGLITVDGVSVVGVSFLFLAIALFASYLPARRATRVDPMVALRHE